MVVECWVCGYCFILECVDVFFNVIIMVIIFINIVWMFMVKVFGCVIVSEGDIDFECVCFIVKLFVYLFDCVDYMSYVVYWMRIYYVIYYVKWKF